MRTACPQPNINKARPNLVLSPSLSLFLQLFDGVDPVAPPRSGGGRRDDGRRRRGGRRQVCQAGAVFSKSRASLSVSVSSLIANGREHEMMKTAKSGMNFGHGANKRIILLFMCKPDFLIHLNMPHYPNQEMESILVPVVAREEVHPLDEIFETSPMVDV
uniref:Uncharacterized protein n=1 Tax=Oryza barthii TaxID=65489 RepID=A0A0D3F2C0_9ORYZ